MGHSKGFRNRNQMIDPPTKESLSMGIESSQLLKLSQRILDGKAVVSFFILNLKVAQPFIFVLGKTCDQR